ncbi:uncharacterized protein H6S33_003233 [Morchella sextelata]|uniref:uncharacterized protein n=1 Tax=Morchella sextelata TaxID=1174677 RepID=UPI001D04BB24|nr:uncharacterized protein H6S33_003233 [Morchella sextelata]KAH0607245.1 hypothetical protein H6S33_003233 [Morchella sextelata]
MESTNRPFPFERGSPNRRSPPPLAVAAENVSPIDVTMFAWLKSPPGAASAAPLTSTRSADYHPITPQRVTAPKGVPGVGSKSAEHPGMSADVTPTPVPVVLPILPEDKLPSSRPRKKRRQRKIKPSYSPSTIWVGIAKGLGSNEHLLDLLKHYRDEGRDAASKKEIEDWLRSHIPGASLVGGLLNESIRILSQEQGKTGKIIKNQHYFKKVKAALKYRVEFLASASGIERVGDGDHVAAVQSDGVERGPVVIRSAKEGGLQAVRDCAELPGNLIIGPSTADSIETTAGEDCIISEVHVVVQG